MSLQVRHASENQWCKKSHFPLISSRHRATRRIENEALAVLRHLPEALLETNYTGKA